MQLLIDLVLLWALMLGWAFVAVVVGFILMCGIVVLQDWSDNNVK